MSVIPDSRSALAGQFVRALPTVDSVSNMSAHPVLSCPSRRSGPSFALMSVTAARELCLADATNPAESPARLTNLSAIAAVRGRLARVGPLFALMSDTRAAERKSLEGIAGMAA
ncbi:hypothetical protein C5E10_16240 [Pseudoclavibacter sp. RFBG4]|uniref:hypothetical protein n=1 Tax=Pseudoclavibacter sp. RFBG4 TaxID=2080575 RepID=UPI000CE86B8A|nr:hypothetical protein [Pseudoclavibacter sp. RFBG4]PPG26804.1 hypothetical protein C5E10_16240 [Pseudoclavibacter sp. RFBG4]